MSQENQESTINKAILDFCTKKFGVLDSSFLCQSVSVLNPKMPITVNQSASVKEVVSVFQSNKIGCVIVVDDNGVLSGIFTERDCVLKILGKVDDISAVKVIDVMTKDPVTQLPDSTMAYALNLMSQGGFRHLPIVDNENKPIGIISVKDIVDYIVSSFIDDLLAFDVEEV